MGINKNLGSIHSNIRIVQENSDVSGIQMDLNSQKSDIRSMIENKFKENNIQLISEVSEKIEMLNDLKNNNPKEKEEDMKTKVLLIVNDELKKI